MKITTKGRYGMRAIVDLAMYADEGPVPLGKISERQEISEGYLEQIFAKLKKAGLIDSVRGVSGGYVLARDPADISVGDILRALEGDLSPLECPALAADAACSNEQNCVTKFVWKKINDSLEDTVNHISLEELRRQGMEALAGITDTGEGEES